MALEIATEKTEAREIGELASSKSKKEKLSGAEILLRALEAEGVEVIFGYPGGSVLPIYDALYFSKLKHILVRHEQGAAHAAEGYARATGRPGGCLVTSGPGATNLVTGIANAYMDSIPLVAITGQVPVDLIGRDSFQEADITGITFPISKYSYLVKDIRDLTRVIHEAFFIATTGRPGPVVIDIPKDIAVKKTTFSYPPRLNLPGYKVLENGNSARILQAAKAISGAEKPVIFAGGGVLAANASQELSVLAEKMGIPVTTTLMGKGVFPENHPLSLGMLGMHGTAYANHAVSDCDLLIALGVRFDDRVTGKLDTFAYGAKIIHVDIDPAEIGKNVVVDIPIVGDVREVLQKLLELLQPCQYPDWLEQISTWQADLPLNYEQDPDAEIKPQYVIEQIYKVTKGEAYVATEVGQHQMWAAQYYRCLKPRTFASSGGLGTMGFGLPAAIGIQVAHPEAVVFDIAGDGSVQMTSQELATAVNYQLPINVAILDNRFLGMVRQWQELFHDRRYYQSDLSGSPDFVKLAEAYGAIGIRVSRPADVVPVLQEAVASPRPYVLDFIVSREENVYPMVPPGGSLNKMLGGNKK